MLFEKLDLNLPDSDIQYYGNFLDANQSLLTKHILEKEINWKQDYLTFYGKRIPLPRLTAWYGDKSYTYSGITEQVNDWTPFLLELKEKVEDKTESKFNGVLLNFYRDGNDSISWHSDDEKELGKEPVIASISLGEERVFQLKHKTNDFYHKMILENGSLLVMIGKTQENWLHAIPKVKGVKPRINLTFRFIY